MAKNVLQCVSKIRMHLQNHLQNISKSGDDRFAILGTLEMHVRPCGVESIVNQNRTETNTPHYSIAQQATTSIAQTDSTFDAT